MKSPGPRYAILPADVMTDPAVSGTDLRVLALLGRHIDKAGWCTRAQGRMASELKIARGTLQRALARLTEAGYVEVSATRRRDGGQGANRYRVVLDAQSRSDQLDLFAGSDLAKDESPMDEPADRLAPVHSAGRRASTCGRAKGQKAAVAGAPPASPARHPLPHLSEAPPASPMRHPLPHLGEAPSNVPFDNDPLHERPPSGSGGEGAREGSVDHDDLDEALREAAGGAIDPVHPGLIVLSEVYAWLGAGCDLQADILPTVRALAARHRGPPIRSWRYFARAVIEARDRRATLTTVSVAPASEAAADSNVVIFEPKGRRHDADDRHDPGERRRALRAEFARYRRDGSLD